MADTRVQLEVEDWVRENWMRERFGQDFHRRRLKLTPGGVFDFDAVSHDKSIAACISTSSATSPAGKLGVGKLMKMRSDMLFLLLAEGLSQRLMVLTEQSMYAVCMKERDGGRVPKEISFLLAAIPEQLRARLDQARLVASKEVTPTVL